MKIEFLGTGAADWGGEFRERTFSCALIDGALLIDAGRGRVFSPERAAGIRAVLITHSHDDHFSAEALAALPDARVFAHASMPESLGGRVERVNCFEPFEAAGYRVTALPGNHMNAPRGEQTVHYLIEKDGAAFYYATDGAWMTAGEYYAIRGKRLSALAIDSTVGDGHEGDFRIFEHNSLQMVRIMRRTLLSQGVLAEDTPVILTHLARTLHPSQAELEAQNPPPFVVARDGMALEI